MKKLVGIAGLAALLLSLQSLAAYQTEWNDPKYPGDPDATPDSFNSVFKVDGVIFAGYDFMDYSANGSPDSTGGDHTGFRIGRTYLNFRGDVTSGPFKGWGFRVTPDIQRAYNYTLNCKVDSTCTAKNDYVYGLKYAYINIPLANGGKTMLRLGWQQTPEVSGQAGVDLTDIWGHRYLDTAGKSTWDELGLANSTDGGIGFIHKSDYYGIHILVSNGEGFHYANADGLQLQNYTLVQLSEGPSESYGLDLNAMLSYIPTGKNETLRWSINLPFRQQNWMGVDRSEYETITASISDPTDPTISIYNPAFTIYRGDIRAKRDREYGYETDVKLDMKSYQITVGGGSAVKQDRRGVSYIIDQSVIHGIAPTDLATISSHYYLDEDQKGVANYVFFHFKVGMFGGFFRYTEGVSQSNLNGKVGSTDATPWFNKLVNKDMEDGLLGNLTVGELYQISPGKNKFKTVVFGVTFHAHKRFRISAGVKTTTGTDEYGDTIRENSLERIITQGGATESTLAAQLENNTILKTALGLGPTDILDLNDYIGKKSINQEVFIRGEYTF